MPQSPAVVFENVSFAWPDGQPLLASADAAFGSRTGLIGGNGAGKSTLLRLITGELRPTAGRISVTGAVGVLRQDLPLHTGATVAELLGIGPQIRALRAIEAGGTDAVLYDLVGQEWDVEHRGLAALAAAGLSGLGLDRPTGELSGGEAMLVALAGLQSARPGLTLLDEPTNNLDADSKAAVVELVANWPGALLVVSHDADVLNVVAQIVELDAGRLTTFGGNFDGFVEHRAREQQAAEQAVATARQRVRVEQRQRIEAETKLARSARQGRRDVANSKFIGAAADERRRRAQQSAGKARGKLDSRLASAQAELAEAQGGLPSVARVTIRLPDPAVASGRRLVELGDGERSFLIAGPRRVALTGRNGVGKTRLLASMFDPASGSGTLLAVPLCDRIGYLPQRLDKLDDAATVLASVAAVTPKANAEQIRGLLAGFGLRGAAVERPTSSLSGGERFKVVLARLLLADPSPQLVVLDEPTNNLDLPSVRELIAALNAYRGGLLVVSHDQRFLDALGIEVWLELALDQGLPRLREVWR
ncbi:MAG: ATP-binding cassette domain-containing protein [Propionicimonas sp.]|uniref:ABC-F family ATP-binding cassette domain-containing protein n=1 Tax=Propionicimonas sp. TaxID=1955623 RepID=UPI001DEA7649|nr:ABC-F family ATP-binding cassette domain-containing protein [Propionicimonas sp.]MBU4187231.1 ATP-binding cassette domain-containing protein [Actinomycetota bacterium]MBU4364692.1 ATP-binding cassette domain-containing protein [Actinomycetota bacterium]MBU4408844.1 ATP-binding cassette domain-containing protein [Actinomycetota bacterium]MBU4416407.1 ATP-binding cassette domain-containing protein [Actinomycetota bacterium]MBU4588431.1 ATP-binding cassette domain-containing protein [Actinomyc